MTAADSFVQAARALPLRLRFDIYGRDRLYYHTGSAYGVYNLLSYDPDTGRLVGEIVNVSVDESVLTPDGKVDVDKLAPITFAPVNNAYHKLGDKVGNAFADGLKLK